MVCNFRAPETARQPVTIPTQTCAGAIRSRGCQQMGCTTHCQGKTELLSLINHQLSVWSPSILTIQQNLLFQSNRSMHADPAMYRTSHFHSMQLCGIADLYQIYAGRFCFDMQVGRKNRSIRLLPLTGLSVPEPCRSVCCLVCATLLYRPAGNCSVEVNQRS